MLAEPWALAAVAVIAAELALWVNHQRRRRHRDDLHHVSRRELDRLNGRRP
jgi:hypothetical protein